MASLKTSFADLAGCDADELAITTNISIALATIASCLDFSGERQPRDPVRAGLPDRRPRVARAGAARRRDRLAEVAGRPDDPARGVRRRDRRADRGRDGEPRALPLERDRGREGDLRDGARARRAVVRRRLPRHRDRAARPARPRLRPLHGGHAQVAARRTGHGVPLRAAGAAPDAGAGRHRVVRDARSRSRSTTNTSTTTRPPGGWSTARRRRPCSSSRKAGSTSSARSRPSGSGSARAS